MARLPFALLRLCSALLCAVLLSAGVEASDLHARGKAPAPLAPKVFIVSMFQPEAQVWYDRFDESGLGNLTSRTIWIPGLAVQYPKIFCTSDGNICQITVGEGEINAASSMMALVLSPRFDLRHTYFLSAGIAGVNPRHATLGGVALSRFAVQVALQYEIDSRSMPKNWKTGYFAYGRDQPYEYPTVTYGTEVFELNVALRDIAHSWASTAELSDSDGARAYAAKYQDADRDFTAAVAGPKVTRCDTATSDVYFSGTVLAEAFENTTSVWTNGTGVYCMTAQEDNASLEVMLRAAIEGLVDFSRIIVMRTGANFDRPPPGVSDWQHLAMSDQNGFDIAIDNIYNAGMPIVQGLISGWNCSFARGLKQQNYIGNILGSLGGHPDFGLGSVTNGARVAPGGQSPQDVANNGEHLQPDHGKVEARACSGTDPRDLNKVPRDDTDRAC